MKNILLLTDFSKNANNAVNYAMQLFSNESCNFCILNVQKISKYITADLITSPHNTVHDAVIKNPKKSLDALVDYLKKEYSNEDFNFEGVCDYDSFISSVKKIIALKNIDLIAMGTNGMSGIKETIFGSNTIQIVKMIDLPILVIPENYEYNYLDKVLFIDETDLIVDETDLRLLKHFVLKFKAQLNVMTVDKEFHKLKDYIKDVKLNIITVNGLITDANIEEIILKHNIKMVSKIIKPTSFFERIFSKTNKANIAYASKVPLLFL